MKRMFSTGLCLVALTLAFACNRPRVEDDEVTAGLDAADEQSKATISVTGCLTAQGERFVLTKLDEGAAPVASTQVYQLRGEEDDLQPNVGRMVQVIGIAPPASVAQVNETASAPAGTSGQPEGSAEVSTTQTTRFETRTLRVTSVIATEQTCPAAEPGATPGK